MNHIGSPTKFFHGFDDAAGKKHEAFIVFSRVDFYFETGGEVSAEIIVAVDKVNLHT